jgi:cytoskeleton-associated protein 5
VGLDAVNAFLGIADADAARAHAGAVMAAVVAKGMSGRPKTVERATETCLLLCELECAEVVVAALVEKGTKHKVPKCALASTEALRAALASFGTGVVPPKPILKGIAHLFESKDGKVRDAAKDLTVELTRWLGVDAARKDLLEKMRAGMRAEVEASVAKAGVGSARATRLTRKDRANGVFVSAGDDSTPMDVDGDDAAAPSAAAPAPLPDAYEFADPESVLDKLEKAPAETEQPKFWDAVGSGKWKERLGALSQLRALADHPKLASGEYGDVARALKKVVTKDSNIACVGEACAAAGALAEGLRREFRSEARLLLPGMLDKLKDKNTSVVSKNRDALLVFSRRCFSVVEAADDIAAALKHKFPKVPAQTLGWLAQPTRRRRARFLQGDGGGGAQGALAGGCQVRGPQGTGRARRRHRSARGARPGGGGLAVHRQARRRARRGEKGEGGGGVRRGAD